MEGEKEKEVIDLIIDELVSQADFIQYRLIRIPLS